MRKMLTVENYRQCGSFVIRFPDPSPPPQSPDSSPYSAHRDDSMRGFTKQVDLFRRHSRRLSQVAAYAAQSSTNTKSKS